MRLTSRPCRTGRQERESGASAVEFVLWTPFLLLLMFGSVQAGLGVFARHVAISGAQEGARTAREEAYDYEQSGQWKPNAEKVAKDWVTNLVGGLIADPTWEPQAFGSAAGVNPEAGVTVQFTMVSAVPFWQFTITASSQGPVECFYTTNEQCGAA
jgi:Flp pilus assembly protein TadG